MVKLVERPVRVRPGTNPVRQGHLAQQASLVLPEPLVYKVYRVPRVYYRQVPVHSPAALPILAGQT